MSDQTPVSNPESVQLAVTHYEDRTIFDAIHAPEGYVYPELEALVAEAIKHYPNQNAPSWLSPIAAILVVERWLIERAGSVVTPAERPPDGPGGSCDWGFCDRHFHSWRWSESHGWLPVCWYHRDRTIPRRVAHGQRTRPEEMTA